MASKITEKGLYTLKNNIQKLNILSEYVREKRGYFLKVEAKEKEQVFVLKMVRILAKIEKSLNKIKGE